MTKTQLLSLSLSLIASTGPSGVHRVSLKAVDAETGRALAGLSAGVAFNNTPPFSFTPRWMRRQGLTDANGCFAAVGITTRGWIRLGIDPSPENYGWREEIKADALEPVISRTCRLRRRHPTRLVGVSVDCRFALTKADPSLERYRFDLLLRSFLPPYGTGTVSDVEFRVTDPGTPSSSGPVGGARYEVSFPGAGNGGVLRKISANTDFVLDRIDEGELTNDFDTAVCQDCQLGFRIRSRPDGDGRFADARYGYIRDATQPISLHLKGTAPSLTPDYVRIGFDYCLNPTPGENNLESFGRPAQRERVRMSFPVREKEDE